jgi:hypothetical protein
MRIQQAFAHFAHVPQDMPPIHDLHGVRRPLADATRILRRAITTDHLDTGILTQPGCQGSSRAIGQEIHDFVLLQVGDPRAIAMSAAKGKIIDTDDPRGRGRRYFSLTDEAA